MSDTQSEHFLQFNEHKISLTCVCYRLQDMETQYRKEKEEADLLLEQHRLVRVCKCRVKTQST